MKADKILLIGYGNPGRLDDGLGPALAARLEESDIPGLETDADYQLTVEDAHAAAAHDVVIFADAAVSGPEPFSFRPVKPGGTSGFSSHDVEPGEVLALAEELFGKKVQGFALGIRGYRFDEFGEGISPRAKENLAAAVAFVRKVARDGDFNGSVTAPAVSDEEADVPPGDPGSPHGAQLN